MNFVALTNLSNGTENHIFVHHAEKELLHISIVRYIQCAIYISRYGYLWVVVSLEEQSYSFKKTGARVWFVFSA